MLRGAAVGDAEYTASKALISLLRVEDKRWGTMLPLHDRNMNDSSLQFERSGLLTVGREGTQTSQAAFRTTIYILLLQPFI